MYSTCGACAGGWIGSVVGVVSCVEGVEVVSWFWVVDVCVWGFSTLKFQTFSTIFYKKSRGSF